MVLRNGIEDGIFFSGIQQKEYCKIWEIQYFHIFRTRLWHAPDGFTSFLCQNGENIVHGFACGVVGFAGALA